MNFVYLADRVCLDPLAEHPDPGGGVPLIAHLGCDSVFSRRQRQLPCLPESMSQRLFAKDVLYIIGSPDKLAEAAGLFDNP